MMNHLFLLLITVLKITGSVQGTYNRSALSTKYPGFGTQFVFLSDGKGGFTKGYLKPPSARDATRFLGLYDVEKDVTFRLFTRQRPEGSLVKNAKLSKNYGNFDAGKKTAVVTHGWLSSGDTNTTVSIKNALLDRYDMNVFIMDWSAIAGIVIYPVPLAATSDVGEFYGKFLNHLVDDWALRPKELHLIGHSLGAHVSGFAARYVKKEKVGRVTGLDPALPGFEYVTISKDGSLSKNDAQFVDVIHTCAGFLGFKTPLGHVDFYPNGGGPPQPGCASIQEMIEACSHGTSWKLFANSILEPQVLSAEPCGSYQHLEEDVCEGKTLPMGYDTPWSARGVYYLKTTADMAKLLDPIGNFV